MVRDMDEGHGEADGSRELVHTSLLPFSSTNERYLTHVIVLGRSVGT